MLCIGWRNLKRDPKRMVVAVLGVVFAVALVNMEVGMLLGLLQNSSLLIDRSRADIWVSTVDVRTFDFATPMSSRKKFLIQKVEGVEKVEEFNISFSVWRMKSGGNANCQVVAFELDGELAPPLEMVQGDVKDLHNRDAVVVDMDERDKLGEVQIGSTYEIMMRRATVVGFSKGMRSFTTNPLVFTSLKRGNKYGWLTTSAQKNDPRAGDASVYFLVKVKPGADIEAVRRRIQAVVPDVEAHTKESFSTRTRSYWLLETGMGIGFLVAALLGLSVGVVIVSQTLYALTLERLPEFGILKALGASMAELRSVVLQQGLICGALGWVMGMCASLLGAHLATSAGTTILVPWYLVLFTAFMAAGLCSAASLISVFRLKRVEPAMIFRV